MRLGDVPPAKPFYFIQDTFPLPWVKDADSNSIIQLVEGGEPLVLRGSSAQDRVHKTVYLTDMIADMEVELLDPADGSEITFDVV